MPDNGGASLTDGVEGTLGTGELPPSASNSTSESSMNSLLLYWRRFLLELTGAVRLRGADDGGLVGVGRGVVMEGGNCTLEGRGASMSTGSDVGFSCIMTMCDDGSGAALATLAVADMGVNVNISPEEGLGFCCIIIGEEDIEDEAAAVGKLGVAGVIGVRACAGDEVVGSCTETDGASLCCTAAGADLRGLPLGRFGGTGAEADSAAAFALLLGTLALPLPRTLPARLALSATLSTSMASSSFDLALAFAGALPFLLFEVLFPVISSIPLSVSPSLPSSSELSSL